MALASTQSDDHHGSTRLHCDLCDAFNIMVHASPSTGRALWHIFRASDATKIREYLKLIHPKDSMADDPIHCQKYYLGPSQLSQLREQYDVIPFTFQQAVGEAVYIPAGCPHQESCRVLPPLGSHVFLL